MHGKPCHVIGDLLRQLDYVALPQLSRLSVESVRLAERLRSAPLALHADLWNRDGLWWQTW
jgi:hypothetical protein